METIFLRESVICMHYRRVAIRLELSISFVGIEACSEVWAQLFLFQSHLLPRMHVQAGGCVIGAGVYM